MAVKLIHGGSPSDPLAEGKKAALLRDIRGLMRVDHRNIVRVYGYCTEPLALVMEYCPMGSLDKWLAESTIPSEAEDPAGRRAMMGTFCDLFLQVAVAMKHLHSKNIAHNDLKANNVLIKYDLLPGGVPVPIAVVTDLGLAKLGSTPIPEEGAAAGGGGAGGGGGGGAVAPTHVHGASRTSATSFVDACRSDVMFWAAMVAGSGFGALGEGSPTPMPPTSQTSGSGSTASGEAMKTGRSCVRNCFLTACRRCSGAVGAWSLRGVRRSGRLWSACQAFALIFTPESDR